jgi:tryptophan 7-halogenase
MQAAEERAIRSVAVLGGGIIGLSAALAFARALPAVRITLVARPADPAALCDRLPGSLPAIGRFHAAIGLNELELVGDGIATHRLGTRFDGWSADGAPWYHVFGEYGLAAEGVAFHQLWVRARKEKRALAYHHYSAGAVLAEAEKFVHPEDRPDSPLSTYLYALQLDTGRYRERLLTHSAKYPIERIEAGLSEVEHRQGGGIAALRLSDGSRLEADLFIDCTGPSAPLRSALDGDYEDWSYCLPCDSLLLGEAPSPSSPSPIDRVFATSAGWRWSSPLSDRTSVGLGFASAIVDEAQAEKVFTSEAGVKNAERVRVRPGRRPEPWKHNVLALGDAAVSVDPLQSVGLHLAQSAILRALELLPGRDCHSLELREYNRRTEQETARVRDFLALHYLRSGRTDGQFWKAAAQLHPPESLAHTLDQFEARGRLPFFEEESFDKQSWLAVLLGMGVVPANVDPVATRIDPERAAAGMERLAESLAQLPNRLPSYADYLQRMKESRR